MGSASPENMIALAGVEADADGVIATAGETTAVEGAVIDGGLVTSATGEVVQTVATKSLAALFAEVQAAAEAEALRQLGAKITDVTLQMIFMMECYAHMQSHGGITVSNGNGIINTTPCPASAASPSFPMPPIPVPPVYFRRLAYIPRAKFHLSYSI